MLLSLAAANTDDAVRSITAALRAQHFQQALDLARTARQASPKEVRIMVLEGMALTALHKDAEALAVLKSAIAISPSYIPAIEAAVEIEYRQGSPEAAADLKRLLVLNPKEPTAHAMLGVLAWKQSDCPSAVQQFSLAKPVIAAQPDALREFGVCLVKTKQPAEAAGVFGQLIALRPDDRRARYSLAVSLMDAGRHRDAIAALQPLAGAKDPDPIALELTANAHEALRETPKPSPCCARPYCSTPGT